MSAENAERADGGPRPPLQWELKPRGGPRPPPQEGQIPKPFKARLRRLERLFTGCPVYYLTVCTHRRRPLLANPESHASFVAFARAAAARGVFVGRYVLLPDHTHFFAAFTPDSPSLSRWMKSWKNALSKTHRQRGLALPTGRRAFSTTCCARKSPTSRNGSTCARIPCGPGW